MGQLIRSLDWDDTPLGALSDWPQSLKTSASICLNSRFPMVLWWGKDLRLIYNDAWRPSLGKLKHPALGKPGREVWVEIWHIIGPMLESVLATGEATWSSDQLLPMDRHGYLEETYWTYSYSPIREEDGRVGGVFTAVTETTERVLGERRLRTLRELAAHGSSAKTPEEAGKSIVATLACNQADVPFAFLYLLDEEQRSAQLCATTSDSKQGDGETIDFSQATSHAGFPLGEVVSSGEPLLVDVDLRQEQFARVMPSAPGGPLGIQPQRALLLPLRSASQDRVAGVLALGVNPARALDEEHRDFLDLVAGNVATSLANARAYADERRRAEELAALDHAKTAFFSNVSHEFRTPLTLMLGPVEELLARSHTDLAPAAAGQLEVVNRNGLRLLRLVNSLLDFSRIEAGRVRALYQATDLAAFTADLASNFRAACERAGLGLRVDCQPLPEPVFVDRGMWEKIVLNLLSNAFKFTFEGEIRVSLEQVTDGVELRVSDTGTGIPSEEMPKLFERFHRVEHARGRTHEGSGIGLALVQELVRLHGGRVDAESTLGKGTTFTVRVPLGVSHLPPEQLGDGRSASTETGAAPFVEEALRWLPDDDSEPLSELSISDASPQHLIPDASLDDARPLVLVVDDNADMRQYIERILAPHFRVETAPDGRAALEHIEETAPDVILTDIMMPHLDGFGLLQRVRQNPRTSGITLIMLSARAGEESRVEGIAAGADDYLVKPFSARELLARVTTHVQMTRLRREADSSLRASEEFNRSLMEGSADCIKILDFEGRLVHMNTPGLCAMEIDDLAPFCGLGWADLWPQEARRRVEHAITSAQHGDTTVFQAFCPTAKGTPKWWDVTVSPVRDAKDGSVVRLLSVSRDVTERKKAEILLEEERDRLQVTLASIGDAVITTDTEGRVANLNAVAEALTGWSCKDAAGAPMDKVFHIINEYTRKRVENPANRVLREGVIVGLANHTLLIAKDGTERPIDDSAAPIRGVDGKTLGCVLVFRDVTERHRAEEELRRSEQRYRLVGEAANDAIWDWNLLTNEVTWNMGSIARFGYTQELVGSDASWWVENIHPDDRERVVTGIHDVIDGEGSHWSAEYLFCRADGSYAAVFDRGRVVRESGKAVRMVGSMLDLTERRSMEDELRQIAADLSEANRRKDEFLATLAHELRNPLAPLSNALKIMKISDQPRPSEQARELMERQLEQLVRLVDDLMDVSRITRGKVELRREHIQLASVVNSAIETSRPLLDQMRHELIVDLPEQPVVVDADLTRLAQVFMNLLNNAAKYSEPGGKICVSARLEGDGVVVSVLDSGIGIPTDKLTTIFDMFSQVERSLDKAQGGLGIGLTLVKRLVEMHGGEVEARSEGVGSGAEFIVRLPVVTRAFAKVSAASHQKLEKSSLRVLIVDDNQDGADSVAMLLQMLGNETSTAYNGKDGFAMAEKLRPDVVLLDIGLPIMNGYEVCRSIRQHPWGREVFMVAVTGWGQEEDRRRSREAGFDHHMVKPLDADALMKLLQKLRPQGR